MIGTWGQDNKGRSLTINDEIVFFRFELSKKNRLSMMKLYFLGLSWVKKIDYQ
jgi:hypothetical protein